MRQGAGGGGALTRAAAEPAWRSLLGQAPAALVVPWLGGRDIEASERAWRIDGPLPPEHGWHEFVVGATRSTKGRSVRWKGPTTAAAGLLRVGVRRGYLVGDRLVPDDVAVATDPAAAHEHEAVRLLDDGEAFDRFTRIWAGRIAPDGPLIYGGYEMPGGPEAAVLDAFLEGKASVADIPGVTPALDAAFRFETWHRAETARLRAEAERRRREEEARRAVEERRRQIVEKMGDGAGRREMALVDFGEAAKAALAVGGAVYLDHRKAGRGEMAVRYRLGARKFECVCDERTLRIIDSGICITEHRHDSEFAYGTKGDGLFVLESLPGVVLEAIRGNKLVVYRHVDDRLEANDDDNDGDDYDDED